jgi:CheY-like chemotaxis protein
VLINLLSNAVKFSFEGSEIQVNVWELEAPDLRSVFYFEVADHGIGISENSLAKLFKPFEQAEGGITRTYGGTGLGLAISKSLVEMMGGEMSLASREGEGSVFSFTIRCAAQPKTLETHIEKTETAADYNFSGRRCLVVDDVEINRVIIQELLSCTGITLETAENGSDAVEKFMSNESGYYNLILMDMQMPVMDGCTATRHIRAIEAERNNEGETNLPLSERPDESQRMSFSDGKTDLLLSERPDESQHMSFSEDEMNLEFPSETPKLLSERPKGVSIIAMTANVMQEDVKMALDSGMNAHLAKPIEVKSMLEMLARLLA